MFPPRGGVGRGDSGFDPDVIELVWARVGSDFFTALVTHLADAFSADCVYLGELLDGTRVRVLAVAGKELPSHVFEGAFPSTIASYLIKHGSATCEAAAAQAFPSDPILQATGASAFTGSAMFDSRGAAIGILTVLSRKPNTNFAPIEAALRAFTARACAELERKRADDSLRESEERYHAFFSRNTDGMWRIEFEQPIPMDLPEEEQIEGVYSYGYIAECNDTLARWFGKEPETLIGARLADVLPRSEQRDEEIRFAIRSGHVSRNVEIEVLDADGNRAHRLRRHWAVVEHGALVRIWGVTRDITDLRQAELESRESERRFRSLLENVRMAAVMVDSSGRITFCNDYLQELVGWPADEMLGKNWVDLLVPEEERERLKSAFADVIAGSQPHDHFGSTILTRDGARRLLEWDSAVLRDPDGAISGVASLGKDVTERMLLEAQLRQAQKLESMGRLAAGIAHDFNNLLTVYAGSADMLLEAHPRGSWLRPVVEEIVSATERGAAITRQLLAFSHKQPVEAGVLSLNQLIQEDASLLARLLGEDVDLTLELTPPAHSTVANPGQIHQILINLAVNARDAMPHGGRLSIATSNVAVEENSALATRGVPLGSYVMMTVVDTGLGMTEEVKSRLFDPFFTTKEPGEGIGLGLSTVYGIVRERGGHILVDSELGKGTVFRILFPATRENPPARRDRSEHGKPAGGHETVLVVEDQPDVRKTIAAMLRAVGYQVLEAETGAQALSVATGHSGKIDLLVTDLVMPGMQGTELAENLVSLLPGLKVIYMSGYAASDTPGPWIQKPFSWQMLAAKVREVLDPSSG